MEPMNHSQLREVRFKKLCREFAGRLKSTDGQLEEPMTAVDKPQPSPQALSELQINATRIRAAVSALLLWERVLTPEDRRLLGGNVQKAYSRWGTAGMWAQLRGVSSARAIADVAWRLEFVTQQRYSWLLRELGEIHYDPEQAVAAAVATGDLVLLERPRRVWWRRVQVALDWDNRSALWDYFWELCRRSKDGESIDRFSFGDAHSDVAVKQKSRLKKACGFPTDLANLIRPSGRGTQKLDLPPAHIRIFEPVTNETLKECLGSDFA
jgi:hypothetical protein